MSKARIYARNLAANWIGHGANLAVAFFMSPFIVHSLGDERYGLWSLMMSITGYLGLVDIGVRGSTGRYINYYLGRNEPENVSRVVNTSLMFYTAVSVAIFGVASVLGMFFGSIFTKFPAELAAEAKWLLLLLALNVWAGFFGATFSQLLTSNNRFDFLNIMQLTVLGVKTAGVVWVLSRGEGIIALAMVHVTCGLIAVPLSLLLAKWKGSAFSFGLRFVNWNTFKKMFGFGKWAFVGNAATRLVYYTDTAVIGLLIGVNAITYYSIGAMLLGYGRTFVGHVVSTITPDIMKAGGARDFPELRWMVIRGTRMTMFFAVPLLVGFMVLGREFIGLWMGPEYKSSAWILFILTIPQFGALATRTCGSALVALGRVRFLALTALGEGVANLIASVAFVTLARLGIYGVALGTVVAMMANVTVQPIYTCRKIGLPLRNFAQKTTFRWVASALAFAALCVAAIHMLPPDGWGAFWLKVGVLSVCYVPIGLFVGLGYLERCSVLKAIVPGWTCADPVGDP